MMIRGVSHVQPRAILGLIRLYLRATDPIVRRLILGMIMVLAREAQLRTEWTTS